MVRTRMARPRDAPQLRFVALRFLDVGDLLRAQVAVPRLPLADAFTRFQLGCLARIHRDGDFEPSSEEEDTDSDMSLDDIEEYEIGHIQVHQRATNRFADMEAPAPALQEVIAAMALQEINATQALDAAKAIAELAINRVPNARKALGYAMLVCMFHDFEDVLRACSSEPLEILRPDDDDDDEERTAPGVGDGVYRGLISGAVSDDLDRGGCTMHVTVARLKKNGVPLTDVLPVLERDSIHLMQFMRLAEEGLMDDMMTEMFVGRVTLKQKCVVPPAWGF
jgi:hypothetical protein